MLYVFAMTVGVTFTNGAGLTFTDGAELTTRAFRGSGKPWSPKVAEMTAATASGRWYADARTSTGEPAAR